MALFSRRKKSDASSEAPPSPGAAESAPDTDVAEAAAATDSAPEVNISVQAFRGVGADAGGAVSLEPAEAEPAGPEAGANPTPSQTPSQTIPGADQERPLPLAPLAPPVQNHTVPGMDDNILLRDALARLPETPTNEQLLGVLRQALQGHLILRVHGDAQRQLAAGESLQVGMVRDGERKFLLGFSSAEALRRFLQQENEPQNASAVAQPVIGVMHQVIAGEFTGLILDNASVPHRAVFPTEVLKKVVDEADPKMAVKALLAAPRAADTETRLAEALAETRMWIGAGQQPGGQVGIAEVRTPDGKRYLQLFSHPLEVVALGRGERPLSFTPQQLGSLLGAQPELAGVLLDPAGPTMVVRREALAELIAKAPPAGAADATASPANAETHDNDNT